MAQVHDLDCGRGMISTAALQILCSSTYMWFADPQTTCKVNCLYFKPYAGIGFSRRASTRGLGLQKAKREPDRFSEPPNKEFG
jgi:hypothetical protein